MSMTAATIFAEAPLGALVRWNDGSPRPPVHHVRKVLDCQRRNGAGRLVERHVRSYPGLPDSFTIHEGDFGEGDTIVLRARRVFNANDPLTFTIVTVPQPGEALIITSFAGKDELQHVACDRAAAERWQAAHGYRDARIDIVPPAAIAA